MVRKLEDKHNREMSVLTSPCQETTLLPRQQQLPSSEDGVLWTQSLLRLNNSNDASTWVLEEIFKPQHMEANCYLVTDLHTGSAEGKLFKNPTCHSLNFCKGEHLNMSYHKMVVGGRGVRSYTTIKKHQGVTRDMFVPTTSKPTDALLRQGRRAATPFQIIRMGKVFWKQLSVITLYMILDKPPQTMKCRHYYPVYPVPMRKSQGCEVRKATQRHKIIAIVQIQFCMAPKCYQVRSKS